MGSLKPFRSTISRAASPVKSSRSRLNYNKRVTNTRGDPDRVRLLLPESWPTAVSEGTKAVTKLHQLPSRV
ncbi:hypothetical protein cypCar_00014492 [Cyprinus carpio]|nr:hypothetical protein cypCar_00014492 [Cyprinus carpio]